MKEKEEAQQMSPVALRPGDTVERTIVTDRRRMDSDGILKHNVSSYVAEERLRKSAKTIQDVMNEINSQREEILKAFLAKYNGIQPDEVEQIIQPLPDGIRYYVRRRKDIDAPNG